MPEPAHVRGQAGEGGLAWCRDTKAGEWGLTPAAGPWVGTCDETRFGCAAASKDDDRCPGHQGHIEDLTDVARGNFRWGRSGADDRRPAGELARAAAVVGEPEKLAVVWAGGATAND